MRREAVSLSHLAHRRLPAAIVLALCLLGGAFPVSPVAAEIDRKSSATVYVPAYSQVYQGARNSPFLLTIILMIRNTDPYRPITVKSIEYFDSHGEPITEYTIANATLSPLSAQKVIIDERDERGGSGACFLVRWTAKYPVSAPIIEAVMVSTTGGQGISFVSRGVEVDE